MCLELSLWYCLFVFMAVVGLIQTTAVHNDLKGISFFRNKYHTYIFAALTIGGSLFALFTWNYWYDTGIIEGSQQLGLFAASVSLAMIITLLVSSAVNHALVRQVVTHGEGLESLKTATFIHVMRNRLKRRN
jgi:hypothetical protein